MNSHEIESAIEFHRHELGLDQTKAEVEYFRFVRAVEAKLGHDLDGDQEVEGYSLDVAHDFFSDGLDVDSAVSEFTVLKRQAVAANVKRWGRFTVSEVKR